MKQRTVNLKYVLLIIMIFSIGTGCEESPQAPPDEPIVEEEFNPNSPNANELIISQRLLGDADKITNISEIIDSGDGGFYFRGDYNNEYALGKLDPAGQEVWVSESRYGVQDICRLSELSGALSNSVLSVGYFGSDSGEKATIGLVSLFDSAGGLIDELAFSNDSANVGFYALEVFEASGTLYHLIAVGYAGMAGIYYPYVARFTVANDSTMSITGEKVFTDLPSKYYCNIQSDLEQTPADCYVQGDEYSADTDFGDQIVSQMSGEMELSWSQDIVPQAGLRSGSKRGRGFVYSSNILFMSCTTEIDKESDPANGGYWYAGVIARLSTDGSVDWMKSITLSQYSEKFRSCYFGDGFLSVAGICSSFMKTKSKNVFGNALLLDINPDTGDVITSQTFGSKFYRSGFNHAIVRGSQAYAVGFTNYEVDDGPSQGWFVVIDVKRAPVDNESLKPVMGLIGDRDIDSNSVNFGETGFPGRN